ncbi:hypothetical protein PVL29_002486 [Vitis rotundifolia]|uniref:Uncharacterized protein n=1 Tax=Vitis rotundifolia TaxID=103349 RepID=A0AA39AJN7_VITRO|nr:hypothetical protein PVL29_002486 [Vitis rotundifolia]
MDSLWHCLSVAPDLPLPYPWARHLDMESGTLFYINVEGSAENIVDLRRCVNLEGGMYYNNMLFDQLIQRNVHSIPFVNVDARHSTFRIFLTKCYGRPTYLLVPGDVIRCPFCNRSF